MASNAPCLLSSLALNGLRLSVRLGCGEEERRVPQYVRFDVRLRFPQPPGGCISDHLDETVCYAQLSDSLREVCSRGEYKLIEKLAWDGFHTIKKNLPQTTQLWIRVTKEKPPVADLLGGATFCLSDYEFNGG